MKHSLFIKSLCATGILLPQISCTGEKKIQTDPEKPNIIFILADDMGYGDLSCYGNEYVQTPNIDRLAETGTRFNQCYAGSGISSPSRCALMTGRNTGNTRIRDNMCTAGGIAGIKVNPDGDSTIVRRANLLPQDTTIATVLSAAGYRTCLVNKWHLDGYDKGASPNHRGFDEFYGWTISTVHSNSPYYYPYYRFHGDSLINIPENANGKHGIHNNDLSTNDAIAFIRRNQHNPFFLYLAYDAPHEPYNIDQTAWYDGQETWTPDTKRYASLITHMDAAIGRLLDELDKLNLRENTLIIFASDNGAAVQAPIKLLNCNAGFKGRKGMLYEGGIRVPFIVSYPGHIAEGTKSDQIMAFWDIMPTFAELIGNRDTITTDGISMLPSWTGGRQEQHPYLYWEFHELGGRQAVRMGDWKGIRLNVGNDRTSFELYNLADDIHEERNVATENPDITARINEIMDTARTPSELFNFGRAVQK